MGPEGRTWIATVLMAGREYIPNIELARSVILVRPNAAAVNSSRGRIDAIPFIERLCRYASTRGVPPAVHWLAGSWLPRAAGIGAVLFGCGGRGVQEGNCNAGPCYCALQVWIFSSALSLLLAPRQT